MASKGNSFLAGLTTDDAGSVADDPESLRIAEAAIEAITVLGWRRLTMSDVARRAKIGRATLYRYFAGKDELRDAVVQIEIRRFVAGSTAARAHAPTVEDALTASFAFTLQFLRENPLLDRMRQTDREMLLDTICNSQVIAVGREFSAQQWKIQLYDGNVSDAGMTHLRTASEITTRLVLSLIVNPESVAAFDKPDQIRNFARHFLTPLFALPQVSPNATDH